jgi:pyruvate ferredoxin oxidoreductase delta subunit
VKKWTELIPGAVILKAGNSSEFKTGSWRAFRPEWIEENCIQCLKCWVYCPDMSVNVRDGKRADFNLDYCKGCGICALECPGKKGKKAIQMVEEGK